MENYLTIKQPMHVASWMNLKIVMLSEGSQTENEYILYVLIFTYVKSQKIQVNFLAVYSSCQWCLGWKRVIGEA